MKTYYKIGFEQIRVGKEIPNSELVGKVVIATSTSGRNAIGVYLGIKEGEIILNPHINYEYDIPSIENTNYLRNISSNESLYKSKNSLEKHVKLINEKNKIDSQINSSKQENDQLDLFK